MLIKLIAVCLLLTGCASAQWTREDTYRQTAFVAITSIDWLQTREIARNPDRHSEMNPILGEHPSEQKVDVYFATCIAAHTAIAVALPPQYRVWWQYVWIGLESATVAHNFSAGIGVGF